MDEQHQTQVLAKENRIVPEDFKGEGEKGLHLMAQTGAWFLGKHRMKVAISNLYNQPLITLYQFGDQLSFAYTQFGINKVIMMMQEELEELEIVGESSIVCNNVISSAESVPNPLLTLTRGPVDANWDRWFVGGCNHNSTSHNRWI